MSGDSLTNLVSLIPTLLAVVIIAFNMIIAYRRGFKKSAILLMQYFISLAVGVVIFFLAVTVTYSDKLGALLSSLGPDFAEATSIVDVVHIALKMFLPNFAGAASNIYLQQFIYAIAGLVVNAILAVICLVLIPPVWRTLMTTMMAIAEKQMKKRQKPAKPSNNPLAKLKPRINITLSPKKQRLLSLAMGAVQTPWL